jgi:hypothetical protein
MKSQLPYTAHPQLFLTLIFISFFCIPLARPMLSQRIMHRLHQLDFNLTIGGIGDISTWQNGQPEVCRMLLTTGQRRCSELGTQLASTGDIVMTNQPEERKFTDKSTNAGQQQHGNMPSEKGGQGGQQQQSHSGQGQQGNVGSGKSGQQQPGQHNR